jgi:hypothetical protein
MTVKTESIQSVYDRAMDQMAEVRKAYVPDLAAREVGTVTSVGTGIAMVSGLPNVGFEELVRFPGDLLGIAFNVDEGQIGVVLLGEYFHLHAGDEVARTGRVMDVAVGNDLLGRVIDPLGRTLDGKGPAVASERLPIERPAAPIMDRAPVTVPLQTGLKVIDALIPIGRLLERATHLGKDRGGGSHTALPIIETVAQDTSAYIPTNLISITDGQIYLSIAVRTGGAGSRAFPVDLLLLPADQDPAEPVHPAMGPFGNPATAMLWASGAAARVLNEASALGHGRRQGFPRPGTADRREEGELRPGWGFAWPAESRGQSRPFQSQPRPMGRAGPLGSEPGPEAEGFRPWCSTGRSRPRQGEARGSGQWRAESSPPAIWPAHPESRTVLLSSLPTG